jgi:hypothetical protein
VTTASGVTSRPSSLTVAAVVCAGIAVAALVLPTSLAFDPWAWLVWGREVLRLDLDTTGGPSWKPLPVAATSALALLGGLAPTAWLVLARTFGLLALVFTYRLADRLAGRAAGLLAAAGLLLSPDGGPRFLRLVAEGHSAPVEAALVLWAVESHLDGRFRRALALTTAVALLRPEAWPFLGLYALWHWRHRPGDRVLVAGLLASVPLLWFGGDWWGSGDPLHGAGDAQVSDDPTGERLLEGLDHAAKAVVVPIWVGVVATLVTARRRGEQVLLVLGAGALSWMVIVVAMSVGLRYAALSRFLLPAAAVLCVLGGVGLVRLVAGVPVRWRTAVVVALVLVGVTFAGPRVWSVGDLVDDIVDRGVIEDDLVAAVDAVGHEAVLACGRVVADPADLPQAALAWELDVSLADITRRPTRDPHVAVLSRGGSMQRRLEATEGVALRALAANEHWTILAVDCPAATVG